MPSTSEVVQLGKLGSRCVGEVQVFDKGRWRRLKAYMWTLKEAAVVCQQLDCGSAVAATESESEGDEEGLHEVYRFGIHAEEMLDFRDGVPEACRRSDLFR